MSAATPRGTAGTTASPARAHASSIGLTAREGPARSGFQGTIEGATLSDLVQMECFARSRGVVRVTSGREIGHLYFRDGAVVHAAVRALVGEDAALAMLAWVHGTFEPVERPWPVEESISTPWQSLLLRAAQRSDEAARLREPRATPRDAGQNVPEARTVVPLRIDSRSVRPGPPAPPEASDPSSVSDGPVIAGAPIALDEYALIVRMNREGVIVTAHPSEDATQLFADIAAYALRLGSLIGDELGIERLLAMECTLKEGRCFFVLEGDGAVWALKPRPATDVAALRDWLGL